MGQLDLVSTARSARQSCAHTVIELSILFSRNENVNPRIERYMLFEYSRSSFLQLKHDSTLRYFVHGVTSEYRVSLEGTRKYSRGR